MVNEKLAEYLKKHSGKYRLEDLKKKILLSGYSEKEFDEAVKSAEIKPVERVKPVKTFKPVKPMKPVKPLPVKKEHPVKPVKSVKPMKPVPKPAKPIEKEGKTGKIKWMRISGIIGTLLMVIIGAILAMTFSQAPIEIFQPMTNTLAFTYILISLILVILVSIFYYGFVKLGGYANVKALKTTSWMVILFTMIIFVVGDIVFIFQNIKNTSLLVTGVPTFLIMIVVLLMAIFIVFFIIQLIFSLNLIRIRQVKYARASGIFAVILVCISLIIAIGGAYLMVRMVINSLYFFEITRILINFGIIFKIVQIAIMVFAIITVLFLTLALFKASKQYEQN
jgi:hypothetical protein